MILLIQSHLYLLEHVYMDEEHDHTERHTFYNILLTFTNKPRQFTEI